MHISIINEQINWKRHNFSLHFAVLLINFSARSKYGSYDRSNSWAQGRTTIPPPSTTYLEHYLHCPYCCITLILVMYGPYHDHSSAASMVANVNAYNLSSISHRIHSRTADQWLQTIFWDCDDPENHIWTRLSFIVFLTEN